MNIYEQCERDVQFAIAQGKMMKELFNSIYNPKDTSKDTPDDITYQEHQTHQEYHPDCPECVKEC